LKFTLVETVVDKGKSTVVTFWNTYAVHLQ